MTIYLVRHARAGSRGSGPNDILRPLDHHGRAQADELKIRLGERPIAQVVSSPALRCAQTVEPLADALGLSIHTDDTLWEGQPLEPVLELLGRAASADADSVLCSHGDIIPSVMGALRQLGVPTSGRKRGCAKGSFWELQLNGGAIHHAIYHPIA